MASSSLLNYHLRCKTQGRAAILVSRPGHHRVSVICASTDTQSVATRRSALAVIVGIGGAAASGALAEPAPTQGEPAPAVAFPVSTPTLAPQANDPTVFNYDFVSDVPCNLRVREYWSIINQNRPRTWQLIAQQIQTGKYDILSIDLNLAPMADLRQAALYLPWALLQNYDYAAAVDAMKAYKNLDDHIKDLQRAASVAAILGSADVTVQQAQQVQQVFILMSASLDGYLATVPSRYTTTLSFFGKGNGNSNGNGPAPAAPVAPTPAQAPAPAAPVNLEASE